MVGRRKVSSSKEDVGDGRIANNAAKGSGNSGSNGGDGGNGSGHGVDELSIFVKGSNGAVVKKIPLDPNNGQPVKGESRRLIAGAHTQCPPPSVCTLSTQCR